MVVIEFKKETHEHTMNLLHRVKKDICELFEIMDKPNEAHGERKYFIDSYDERRGGMGSRNEMEERRRRDSMGRYASRGMEERGGMRDNSFDDRRYPEYPFDERGGGRYNY